MKLYSVVLEVPADMDITLQDAEGNYVIGNDVAYQIAQLFTIWPSGISPGTKVAAGKKLISAVFRSPTTQPLGLVQSLLDIFGLPWIIKGLKTFDAPINIGTEDEPKWVADFFMPLSDDVIPYIDKELEDQEKMYDGVDRIPIYDDSVPPVIIDYRDEPHFVGYMPITQFPFSKYDGGSSW